MLSSCLIPFLVRYNCREFLRNGHDSTALVYVRHVELLDTVALVGKNDAFPAAAAATMAAKGAKSIFKLAANTSANGGATVLATFADGSPAAVLVKHGAGKSIYAGFHSGLSYFDPAMPDRPVDRGSLDSSYNHFIPVAFNAQVRLDEGGGTIMLHALSLAAIPYGMSCIEKSRKSRNDSTALV